MKLFFLLGFRNVFRNKRRTFLTCSVIAIALCSLVLIDGLMIAMKHTMVRLQTSTYMGEAQVHSPNYQEDDDISNTIKNQGKLLSFLKTEPLIKNFSPRVLTNGMLSSSYESQIVRVVGVDFSKEKHLSKLSSNLSKGTYPNQENSDNAFILGEKLAKKLRVRMGERLILTFSEKISSDVTQEMFKLTGVVNFNMRPLDDLFIFIDIKKAQKMFGLKSSEWHEVALKFDNETIAEAHGDEFKEKFSQTGNLYESWGELAKPLKSMLDMTQYSMSIIYGLVFIFILFAILNTMFMSIFERSFEFGVIKALGSKKGQVAYLVLCECFSLGVLGSFLGMLIAGALMYYLSLNGISYGGSEFNGISLSEPIKPVLTLRQFTEIPAMIILITILSGLYPAIHTARMKISDAMKKSL